MRLHRLEATAFGPFAATVEVDFDELSDAGVFLLTGATGAGKSSVLDAVCFALYGQVPGDRQGARHLRSDQAPVDLAPLVVLDLSVAGRRFRFSRSPAWSRPKRRGRGSTKVPAHVVVEELAGGTWEGLTNRLDDAGLLVGDLLGMNVDQFTQVALLPQGRFMAFLRARSAERHAVLQKLFRTERFEQVERWLVDRRTTLRRDSQRAGEQVAAVLSRILEVGDTTLPDDWDLHDLSAVADALPAWLDLGVAAAAEAAAEGAAARQSAELAATRTACVLADVERVHQLRERAARAQDRLARLHGRRALHDARTERLEAHRRAIPVARSVERAASAAAASTTAALALQDALASAAASLQTDPAGLDAQSLASARDDVAAARAVAQRFLPRERELATLRESRQAVGAEIEGLGAELVEARARLEALPPRRRELTVQLDQARRHLQEVSRLSEAAEAARRRLEAGTELVGLLERLAESEAAVLVARATTQTRREHHLDLREARIQGIASELALGLAVGADCPVCGSPDHPHPASPGSASVGRAEEDEARKAYESAQFDQQLHEHKVVELQTERRSLETLAGQADVASLERLHAGAASALAKARASADRLPTIEAALQETQASDERTRADISRLDVSLAAARTTAAATDERIHALTTELAELLAGKEATTLAASIAAHDELARHLERASAALHDHDLARRAAEDASAAAFEAATDAGFVDVPSARDARMDPETADLLAVEVDEFVEAERAAQQVLAEPDVAAVAEGAAPDLLAARLAADTANAVRESRVVAAESAAHRHARLERLVAEVGALLVEWAPLRERFREVAALASLVEGTSSDNPQKIRLSAYVLGERLRQVVASANERLAAMTDQRYSLEHVDDKGAGEQRGGLSLRVVDDWSGRSRDPATLSGGETFLVSLALALGLADTVSHEAGGTDIDTLFVDEGFGSLDAETLDDVLDTLDTLRDGGRVVGLVSHVAEMRTRITTQLEIRKGREGSSVHAVVSSG